MFRTGADNGALELVVRPARLRDLHTGEPFDGYPYGVLPRYLLTWISTEAVQTQSPTLSIGETLSSFLERLNLSSRGGVRGDLTRLNDQAQPYSAPSSPSLIPEQLRIRQ